MRDKDYLHLQKDRYVTTISWLNTGSFRITFHLIPAHRQGTGHLASLRTTRFVCFPVRGTGMEDVCRVFDTPDSLVASQGISRHSSHSKKNPCGTFVGTSGHSSCPRFVQSVDALQCFWPCRTAGPNCYCLAGVGVVKLRCAVTSASPRSYLSVSLSSTPLTRPFDADLSGRQRA